MNDHTEAERLLADLAQNRLDGDVRAGMEEHVADCVECRQWLETYTFLARSLAAGDAVDHPAADALAALAVNEGAMSPEARESLAHHLVECPGCRGEVDLVRQAIRDPWRSARRVPSRRWIPLVPIAIAASLVLAVAGGAALVHNAGALRELAAIQNWSGTVGYVIIEDAQRGVSPEPRLRLRAGQPFALVALRLDLSADLALTDSVEVELLDADGGRVWATTLAAEPLRDNVSTYGAAFVPVPSRTLAAGAYEMRVTAVGNASRSLVLQRRLQIEFVE